jgi:hypothetical protein
MASGIVFAAAWDATGFCVSAPLSAGLARNQSQCLGTDMITQVALPMLPMSVLLLLAVPGLQQVTILVLPQGTKHLRGHHLSPVARISS